MRSLLYLIVCMFLLFVFIEAGLAQSQSQHALIRKRIYQQPDTYKLTRAFTMEHWNRYFFNAQRGSVQSYIAAPNYTVYSGATFHLDYGWNRIMYYERLNDWIRGYGSFGSADNELNRPNSIDAHAQCDAVGYNNTYDIFIADTKNDRILRWLYNWQSETMSSILPISNNGLNRPFHLDINNGGTFLDDTDDYLWVLNGDGKIKRITVDGVLKNTFGEYGCEGQPGYFCNPTAIVSGRSDLLTTP